ncbi:MAG: ATP-dependent helicase [Clostridiales bacterium]|nr:ATP-dependent helicase [Clostridiales bacterium]
MLLSDSQLAAVDHLEGPALVLAGPGSGKTSVIINRVRLLIEKAKIDPSHILISTFSKAAAGEMKKRFNLFTADRFPAVTFSTIHSLSYSILRSSSKYSSYSLISNNNRSDILKTIIKSVYNRYDDNFAREISGNISLHKNTGKDKFQGNRKLTDVFVSYASYLEKYRLYDFDDMVDFAYSTFKGMSERKRKETCPYSYLMVDEFQDTSVKQFDLLCAVASNENFFAVGDDDQSIYSFRGSDPSIILNFRKVFPRSAIYILSENYRSVPSVVNLSNRLILHNSKRYSKSGKAVRPQYSHTDSITYNEYENHYEEAAAIAKYIKEKENNKELAVFLRTYGSGEIIKALLVRNNIEFISKGSGSIFDFMPFDIIMSFFTSAYKNCKKIRDPNNRSELLKVLRVVDPTIPTFLLNREDILMSDFKPCISALPDLYGKYSKVEYLLSLLFSLNPEAGFDFIKKACGVDVFFANEYRAYGIPLENYNEKMDIFREILKNISSIEALISFQKSYTDRKDITANNKASDRASVIISSIHSAKGLEFDEVWIPNLNEDIIPSSQSKTDEEIEEERRLLYVAMTRAKEKIIFSAHKYEHGRPKKLSRFLCELDFSNLSHL